MNVDKDTLGGIFVLVWYCILCTGLSGCLHKAGRTWWTAWVPGWNLVEACRLRYLV